MAFLRFFRATAPPIARLPSGSFTVDRTGRIVVTTLPSSFPAAMMREIGRRVLETFGDAHAAQLPLSELILNYGSLKITARELRGGALVFLAPKTISPYGK